MSTSSTSEEQHHIDEYSNDIENTKHSNPYDVVYDNQDDKVGIIETLKNIFFVIQMMIVLIFISHNLRNKRQ